MNQLPATKREPATGLVTLRRISVLIAHAVLGLVLGLVPMIFNHRFYLKDDMEHQFLPMFYQIGRQLRLGEFPILTLSSWFGSNIVSELQFGIFNPVSLALNAILPSITDYEVAAAFLACAYYAILLPGSYVLARSFEIDRYFASLIALCITCSNFLSYWGASNWFPLFSSFAWFVWAWAFLRLSGQGRLHWLLATGFCYLTITIGFPYAILLLGLVATLHLWELLRNKEPFWNAWLGVTPLAAALLLSAVPLLALVGAGTVSTRTTTVFNNGFMMPNLSDVLQVSAPFHFGFLKLWHGYQPHQTPIFFVAWFLLPALVFLRWQSVDWRRPAVLTLLILSTVVVVAFQGPEEFSLLHFLLRWIPFLHAALLLLIGVLATQVAFVWSRQRLQIGLALIGVMHLTSWQMTPGRWFILAASLALFSIALAVSAMLRERRKALVIWLGLVSLSLFALTHAVIPENTAFTDVNFPRFADGTADLFSLEAPDAYEIVLGPAGYGTNPERATEVVSGYIFFEKGQTRINGYSGLGHQPLTDLLCMPWNGSTCTDAAARLFEREQQTQQTYADLFRINSIRVWKGEHLDALRPHLGPEWQLADDGAYTQRFARELPKSPASLAWMPPEVSAFETELSPSITRVELAVTNNSTEDKPLAFSRLWWPGYRAQLDGRELSVSAMAGIFTTVSLPANSSGRLTLFFQPPLFRLGILMTLIGAIMVVICMLLPQWRRVTKNEWALP